MINPYKVLGVPENADMDTIKKAYRNLSRKYHPDANINNPNRDQAEEKFKEIQAAYQQIVDEREKGYSSSYSSGSGSAYEDFFGGFGRQNTRQQDPNSNYVFAAQNYINSGRYREALNTLANVPAGERSAEWYFLSAIANSKLGYNVVALEHASNATTLDPSNSMYRQLYETLQSGGSWYNERSTNYGRTYDAGNCCCWLMAMQACCPGLCCCI